MRICVSVFLMVFLLSKCRADCGTFTEPLELPTGSSFFAAEEAIDEPVIQIIERPNFLRPKLQFPGVEVYADGRCIIRGFDGIEHKREIQPLEAALLIANLENAGFFEISAAQIRSKLKEVDLVRGSTGGFTHGITTTILIRSFSKENCIEWYGLEHYVGYYPSIREFDVMHDALVSVYLAIGESGYHRWWSF